jgi:hypothetical protein
MIYGGECYSRLATPGRPGQKASHASRCAAVAVFGAALRSTLSPSWPERARTCARATPRS